MHDAASKERAPSADAALERWNSLKAQERARPDAAHTHARQRAEEPARRCSARTRSASVSPTVGFDWATTQDVMAKIEEEVAELRETLEQRARQHARAPRKKWAICSSRSRTSHGKLGIEPEAALRKANEKFTKRFNQLEANFTRMGGPSTVRRWKRWKRSGRGLRRALNSYSYA